MGTQAARRISVAAQVATKKIRLAVLAGVAWLAALAWLAGLAGLAWLAGLAGPAYPMYLCVKNLVELEFAARARTIAMGGEQMLAPT